MDEPECHLRWQAKLAGSALLAPVELGVCSHLANDNCLLFVIIAYGIIWLIVGAVCAVECMSNGWWDCEPSWHELSRENTHLRAELDTANNTINRMRNLPNGRL